jgi:hypothetical protein
MYWEESVVELRDEYQELRRTLDRLQIAPDSLSNYADDNKKIDDTAPKPVPPSV